MRPMTLGPKSRRCGYDPAGASATYAASLTGRLRFRRDSGTGCQWRCRNGRAPSLRADRVQRALSAPTRRASWRGPGSESRRFSTSSRREPTSDDPSRGRLADGRPLRIPNFEYRFTVPTVLIANATCAVSISGSSGQAQFSGGAILVRSTMTCWRCSSS